MGQGVASAAVDDPRVTGLVALARAGDQQAWSAVVALYMDDIWRLSLHLVHGDVLAAEELAQRTWEKAQSGVTKFRGEVPVLAWIRRICRNHHVDEWRRVRRDDEAIQRSLDGDGEGDSELPTRLVQAGFEEHRVAGLDLRQAFATLDDDEREAFLLVKGLGYKSLEVAQMVGAPASTVRSRVARARGELAASLGDYQCKAS